MTHSHQPTIYGQHNTPFGSVYLELYGPNLVQCRFDPIKINHKNSINSALSAEIAQQIGQAEYQVPLAPKGTAFQQQVWKALLAIPFGQTASYQDIANAVDRPTAVRAVANAIAANPIAWFIPCHRVIRHNGQLGGYAWGKALKQRLLDWEQHNAN